MRSRAVAAVYAGCPNQIRGIGDGAAILLWDAGDRTKVRADHLHTEHPACMAVSVVLPVFWTKYSWCVLCMCMGPGRQALMPRVHMHVVQEGPTAART